MKRINSLEQLSEPGIYELCSEEKKFELAELEKRNSFQVFYLNGQKIENKKSFLQEIAHSMSFPEYFGENWDAFEDCLTDLELDSNNEGFILFYEKYQNFSQKYKKDFEIALEIFDSAIEFWKNENVKFFVLLSD